MQDRLQQHDQVLAVHVGEPIVTMSAPENGFTDEDGSEVETFSIAIPEYAPGDPVRPERARMERLLARPDRRHPRIHA